MTIVFYHNSKYEEAVEYAFRILSSSLDCHVIIEKELNFLDNQDAIVVSYGATIPLNIQQKHLHIFADLSFWENLGKPQSLPRSPLHRFPLKDLNLMPNGNLEDPLIVPYARNNEHTTPVYWKGVGSKDKAVLVCELDILASAFFWITCYEESLIPERDEFGRIPEEKLLCVREKCYQRPLVDEYCEVLNQLLNQLGIKANVKRETFRVLITHDVDSGIPVRGGLEYFENGLRSFYREVVRERRIGAGVSDCLKWFAVGMGWRPFVETFRDIVGIDKEYGFTSHFFLMANGTHLSDATYDISSKYSRMVIQAIQSCGGKIGLHLGINSHTSLKQFKKEWCNLREVFSDALPASRSHCLVFQVPDTWSKLSDQGCRVDTTLGFSKLMGFRAGTTRPFRPFDVVNQRVEAVWEYPMVIMDKNLFVLPVDSDEKRIEGALKIIDTVADHGGCLVINWHNVYCFSDYLSMYRSILSYVSTRGRDIQLSKAPEPGQRLIW